jgi:hypothetical protein
VDRNAGVCGCTAYWMTGIRLCKHLISYFPKDLRLRYVTPPVTGMPGHGKVQVKERVRIGGPGRQLLRSSPR